MERVEYKASAALGDRRLCLIPHLISSTEANLSSSVSHTFTPIAR